MGFLFVLQQKCINKRIKMNKYIKHRTVEEAKFHTNY